MLVIVAVAGGILGIWLYCGLFGATPDLKNVTLGLTAGGISRLGALWFVSAIPVIVGSLANAVMIFLLLAAVATVCAVGIRAARSGLDFRIRYALRHERAHPRVSGHGPTDDH